MEGLGELVANGYYDLVSPDDEIILPQVWEAKIQPGWEISMIMWPMQEPPAAEALVNDIADMIIVPEGTPLPYSIFPRRKIGDGERLCH